MRKIRFFETVLGYGATLRSPVFPPPPSYNNNVTSVYYKSCRVSVSIIGELMRLLRK
jgi:hypothetical protein